MSETGDKSCHQVSVQSPAMHCECAVLLGYTVQRQCYKLNANYPKNSPMPFCFLASGLGFGAAVFSGSSSCSHHRVPVAISPALITHAVAPQVTFSRFSILEAGPSTGETPAAPFNGGCATAQAEIKPLGGWDSVCWAAWLSGGEEWASTGGHRQVNGSCGCCTIGFCLHVS